jgi:hypothetical protein
MHAVFTTAGSGPDMVRVGDEDDHYIVNWSTRTSGATAGNTYRVRVLLDDEVLGYADVYVGATGRGASPPPAATHPVTLGSTLPIKFRIEGEDDGEDDEVARIEVEPASATVLVGDQQQYTATAYNSSDQVLSGVVFSWSSSDDNIGHVDNSGMATGVAEGTVTITASAGGVNGTATLVVEPLDDDGDIVRIEVEPASATIRVGDLQQYTATAYDAADQVVPGVVFSWSSSDINIATIDATGLATGEDEGTVTITASADGVNGTATLIVDLTTPPQPGRDIVVFNDVNPFDDTSLANPNNVLLVQNLVNFTTLGPRNAGTVVMFDCGRDGV